ncbi:MAG: hypothetical protein PSN34_04825 [Urechidicola sp.]|nr:hypothetical protein [Urechidicola sp.]
MNFNPNYILSPSLTKELLEIERHKEAINILPVTATLAIIAKLHENPPQNFPQ